MKIVKSFSKTVLENLIKKVFPENNISLIDIKDGMIEKIQEYVKINISEFKHNMVFRYIPESIYETKFLKRKCKNNIHIIPSKEGNSCCFISDRKINMYNLKSRQSIEHYKIFTTDLWE